MLHVVGHKRFGSGVVLKNQSPETMLHDSKMNYDHKNISPFVCKSTSNNFCNKK
jgi:hypothetical protein